jgi:hypothetical protein
VSDATPLTFDGSGNFAAATDPLGAPAAAH